MIISFKYIFLQSERNQDLLFLSRFIRFKDINFDDSLFFLKYVFTAQGLGKPSTSGRPMQTVS